MGTWGRLRDLVHSIYRGGLRQGPSPYQALIAPVALALSPVRRRRGSQGFLPDGMFFPILESALPLQTEDAPDSLFDREKVRLRDTADLLLEA